MKLLRNFSNALSGLFEQVSRPTSQLLTQRLDAKQVKGLCEEGWSPINSPRDFTVTRHNHRELHSTPPSPAGGSTEAFKQEKAPSPLPLN